MNPLIAFLFQWATTTLPWLAPLVVSSVTGGVAGFGSSRFKAGQFEQRMASVEQALIHTTEERAGLVTRNEFELLREDIREMRVDVREIRRTVAR